MASDSWNLDVLGPIECGCSCRRWDEDGCCMSCGSDMFYDEDGNPLANLARQAAHELHGQAAALRSQNAELRAEREMDTWEVETDCGPCIRWREPGGEWSPWYHPEDLGGIICLVTAIGRQLERENAELRRERDDARSERDAANQREVGAVLLAMELTGTGCEAVRETARSKQLNWCGEFPPNVLDQANARADALRSENAELRAERDSLQGDLEHARDCIDGAYEDVDGKFSKMRARAEAAEAEVRRMRLECHRIGGDESWGAESGVVGATMRLMAARVLDAGDIGRRALAGEKGGA